MTCVQQYAEYWKKNAIAAGDSAAQCADGNVLKGCPNWADVTIMAALEGKILVYHVAYVL
jgi:hypothetical protein